MNDRISSVLFGTALMLITAIGCISYEKIIVKGYSYSVIIVLNLTNYMVCLLFAGMFASKNISTELIVLSKNRNDLMHAGILLASCITSILWYVIAKKNGVMAGSVYEIKYVVILALIYIMLGENKFTINTLLGLVFAMASVYFISKPK